MSRQASVVTFTGKMGEISFYKRNGKLVARKSAGPSRRRILQDAAFARTRENMSEFGGLARVTASCNAMFAPVKNLRDNGLRGRVSKIFRAMMKADTDPRGQRKIMLTQHRIDLFGFEINEQNLLKSYMAARYTATHSEDRKTATITIPDLRVNTMVTAPLGATHFQLVLLAGVLADFIFNVEANHYEPSDVTRNEMSNVTFSDYIPVGIGAAQAVNLTVELPQDVNDKVSVVQALGILFFTRNGTAFYPSQQGRAMRVVDVY